MARDISGEGDQGVVLTDEGIELTSSVTDANVSRWEAANANNGEIERDDESDQGKKAHLRYAVVSCSMNSLGTCLYPFHSAAAGAPSHFWMDRHLDLAGEKKVMRHRRDGI